MGLKSLLAATVAGATIAGAGLLTAAGTASAANPPYDGCPGWALCLYQHADGAGSKAIITPPGTGFKRVTLYSVNFLNGINANNQVSSWLNNSNCQVFFWDDDPTTTQSPFLLDDAPANAYGRTGSWNSPGPLAYANDHLTAVDFHCP